VDSSFLKLNRIALMMPFEEYIRATSIIVTNPLPEGSSVNTCIRGYGGITAFSTFILFNEVDFLFG
jgi:hypothetical protein